MVKRQQFLAALCALLFLTITASGGERISVETFDPDFPAGDCNYHSITAASDGRIYFTVSVHHIDHAAILYQFDPKSETIRNLGNMTAACGEKLGINIPQGKVHTPLYEYRGKLFFSTHLSWYRDGLPNPDSQGRGPYSGGRFMAYDLETGTYHAYPGTYKAEGIIGMTMDLQRGILYGITWPGAHLVTMDLANEQFRYWGPTQGDGEWDQDANFQKVCRTLGVDSAGNCWGSTADGRIWRFNARTDREITYLEQISLKNLLPEDRRKQDGWFNWRTIRWDDRAQGFHGVLWQDGTAFLFKPSPKPTLKKTADAQPVLIKTGKPGTAQLGYLLQEDGHALYLAHGDPLIIPGQQDLQSQVYLMEIDREGTVENHGPLMTTDGRRVFFTESLEQGPDGRLYSVAWVETVDPARRATIQRIRGNATPDETAGVVYEMLLVRFSAP